MHGNFAAAIQVRQEALQNILLILHRGGELPREVNGPTTIPDINPTGSGSSVLHHTWFLDVPTVTFDPAVSTLARLSFRLAGPLSIQAEGVDLTTRQVRLTLTIDALFQGTIVQVPQPPPETVMGALFAPDPTFDLRVSFTPVNVVASKLRVVGWSPTLPAAWIDFFGSPAFRFGLGMLLADQLTNVQSVLPANLAPILGALRIGNGSTVSLTGIVGDKCATIGIDVANPLHGIATAGDPAAVDNFLGGADIALIVDEGIHSLLGRAARTEINNRQGSVDVTSLTIAFRPGHFRVSGHGEADAGSADFSFHLTPRLGKPEQIEWYDDEYGGQYSEVVALATDEIWLDLSNLEVDENLAWWVILGLGLGGLVLAWFGPPGPAVLGQIVHSVLLAARVKLVTTVEGTNTDLARRWEGTLPGTDVPNIKFKIESIQVFNDRVETRLTLTPQWPAEGTIAGPGSVSIEQIQAWQTFTLPAPFRNYDLADPEIRVRWQLRRSDTNEVVAEATHPPGTDYTTSHFFFARFSPYGVGHSGLSTFTLSVRVYRGLGGPSFDYLNTTKTIHISDSLDRSHPYVHWHHNIPTPEVVNGKQICGGNCPAGWRQNSRHSKIHRTDFPGRCRFAGRYSTSVQQLDYLDDLPFPLADLDANRDQVCDYCFYGGPTRTEKKIGARKIHFKPL